MLVGDVLAEGLATATSPGRLQIVGIEPTVLVDAAHNPNGAAALAAAVGSYFTFSEICVVFAVLDEKDAEGIVRELAPLASRFHVTRSTSSARARPRRPRRHRRNDRGRVNGEPFRPGGGRHRRGEGLGIRRCRSGGARHRLDHPRRRHRRTRRRGKVGAVTAETPVQPDDRGEPRRPVGRARRERSATESLLSITLVLESLLVFFLALVVFSLDILPPLQAFAGGGALLVTIVVLARLMRYRGAIAVGWVVQAAAHRRGTSRADHVPHRRRLRRAVDLLLRHRPTSRPEKRGDRPATVPATPPNQPSPTPTIKETP